MSEMLTVRLHSNAPEAMEATDATLRALGMGGAHLLRADPDSDVWLDKDGTARVVCANPEFVRFALTNQGYVREVVQ